jgi:hypothetical protein
MPKINAEVPATPRSREYSYYPDGGWGGQSSSPVSTVPPAIDPTVYEMNINNKDSNNIVTSIAINPDDPATIDVTKINLTVQTIGSGNVVSEVDITQPATVKVTKSTINEGVNFATSGSGNTVADISYSESTNTLTETRGNCVTRLIAGTGVSISPTSGVGDVQISAASTSLLFWNMGPISVINNPKIIALSTGVLNQTIPARSYISFSVSYAALGITTCHSVICNLTATLAQMPSWNPYIRSAHYNNTIYMYVFNPYDEENSVFNVLLEGIAICS